MAKRQCKAASKLKDVTGQELLKRAQTMIIRFTSYGQKAQLARFLDEVVPLL